MKKDIYSELAKAFDALSFGFPKGAFRTDKAVLKKFYTKEEARYFIDMGRGYITVQDYAEKNDLPMETAEERLEHLANKGLIFRRRRPDKVEYRQYPFMMGLIEFQTHNEDRSWAMQVGAWMMTSPFGERMTHSMPMYRTIPFEQNYDGETVVLPYDDINKVLDRHEVFSVMTCLCRTMFQMKPGNKCTHPMETCIMTDDYARFIIENGWGRQITREETYEILMAGREDGRVMNIVNSQDGENICSCCECGCGLLYLKRKYPGPGAKYWASYYSEVHPDKCVSCGKCHGKCPVGALKVAKDGKISVNQDACLGCGICTSLCKTGGLQLVRKPDEELIVPPLTYDDAMEIWQSERER